MGKYIQCSVDVTWVSNDIQKREMFLKFEQTANEGFDKTISLSMCLFCVSTISSCDMKSVSCLSNVAAYNQWPNFGAAGTLCLEAHWQS